MEYVFTFGMVLVVVSLLIIGHVLEKQLKLLNRKLELLTDHLQSSRPGSRES